MKNKDRTSDNLSHAENSGVNQPTSDGEQSAESLNNNKPVVTDHTYKILFFTLLISILAIATIATFVKPTIQTPNEVDLDQTITSPIFEATPKAISMASHTPEPVAEKEFLLTPETPIITSDDSTISSQLKHFLIWELNDKLTLAEPPMIPQDDLVILVNSKWKFAVIGTKHSAPHWGENQDHLLTQVEPDHDEIAMQIFTKKAETPIADELKNRFLPNKHEACIIKNDVADEEWKQNQAWRQKMEVYSVGVDNKNPYILDLERSCGDANSDPITPECGGLLMTPMCEQCEKEKLCGDYFFNWDLRNNFYYYPQQTEDKYFYFSYNYAHENMLPQTVFFY